jgi:3-dehydroshikimate dehydratase
LEGHLQATPLSRYSVEVFANHGQQPAEGEVFVGEVVTASDASGQAKFSLILDSVPSSGRPATFTATVTSSEGATSEFSQPVAPSK